MNGHTDVSVELPPVPHLPSGARQAWFTRLAQLPEHLPWPRHWSKRTKGAVSIGLVLVGSRLIWGLATTLWEARPVPVAPVLPTVQALRVVPADFKDELTALGTIHGEAEIPLKFETKGVLEDVTIQEGQSVHKGDLLAKLNQRDAKLRLDLMDLRFKEHHILFDIGALSKLKMDQIQLEYDLVKSEFDKTELRAIRDGIMGKRLATPGQAVNPGEQVGTLVAIEHVEVEFGVVEKELPKLTDGSAATVTVDAYPGKTFTGTITKILPQLEEKSRTLTARVKIPNQEGLLRPGMFARVAVVVFEKPKALTVTNEAIVNRETQPAVYVVTDNGKTHLTPVTLGYRGETRTELVKGLAAGALIVTNPSEGVSDGVKVQVVEPTKDTPPPTPGS